MRIVQISDTHFGTEVPPVVAALTRSIHALAPDLILLCGDITQRARPAQFTAARAFMDGMPTGVPQIAIPGNHDLPLFDLWTRVRAPYARYTRAFPARESLWHRDGIAVLALDATSPRRHKDGAIDGAHLRDRLAAARRACGPQGYLVVTFHQPLWTAWGADQRQTLIDRHDAARLLAEARVDAVLTGHVHVPMIETSAVSDPHLAWRFVMSGSGTAVSSRTRPGAPNSFNVLELQGPGALRIVRHDHADAGFAAQGERRFRRGATGWEPLPP